MTHEEALRLIDERIGEKAYIGLILAVAPGADESASEVKFLQTVGRLVNPLAPHPPRLDRDTGYYGFGSMTNNFPLAPIAERIELRDAGLDFHLAGGSRIRVAWTGSSEIGGGPDVGNLARLRLMGLVSEDDGRRDDRSIDLQRFLATAPRASAEILSARPTDNHSRPRAGEARRIWRLELRVDPDDGPAFEASAEVSWPLIDEVEERLSRGESLTCMPATKESIEVAFDPEAPAEVMAYPDAPFEARPIRFKAAIIGQRLNSS